MRFNGYRHGPARLHERLFKANGIVVGLKGIPFGHLKHNITLLQLVMDFMTTEQTPLDRIHSIRPRLITVSLFSLFYVEYYLDIQTSLNDRDSWFNHSPKLVWRLSSHLVHPNSVTDPFTIPSVWNYLGPTTPVHSRSVGSLAVFRAEFLILRCTLLNFSFGMSQLCFVGALCMYHSFKRLFLDSTPTILQVTWACRRRQGFHLTNHPFLHQW